MKSIKLPTSNSVKIWLPEPELGGQVHHLGNGTAVVPNGTNVYVDSYAVELAVARENGGKIICSTTGVEIFLEEIIKRYLFEKPVTETKKTEFFLDEILHSRFFQLSLKNELVVKIIKKENLLCEASIKKIRKSLEKIMEYRNAFAHNPVKYESDRGCLLKDKLLDNEYWDCVEDVFNTAKQLLSEVLSMLSDKALADKRNIA
jgi:hypothetical protein